MNKRAQLLKGIAAEMVAPDTNLMYDEDSGDEYPTAPLQVDLAAYTIVARLQGYGDEADECPLDAQSLRDLADDITYDANRLHRAAQYLNRIAYREAQNGYTPKAADEIVEAWNNIYGDSTPVIYIDDNGKQCPTVTRSEAWVVGDADPIVKIKGKIGGVALERVIPYDPSSFWDTQFEAESERTTVRVFMRHGECEDAFARDQHPDVRIEVEVFVMEDDRGAYKDAQRDATDNTQHWMTIPYRQ